MKIGVAGSLESNDALITVTPSDKMEIEIDSIVYDFFHEQRTLFPKESHDFFFSCTQCFHNIPFFPTKELIIFVIKLI